MTQQTLSQDERESIVERLTGGWERVFDDTGDLLLNRPGFVSGNEARSPIATAVRSLTRYNCRVWARADKSGFSQRINRYNEEVCRPYLASLNEQPEPGALEPTFAEGQCSTPYGIQWEALRTNNGIWQEVGVPGAFVLNGPIAGITRRFSPSINNTDPGLNQRISVEVSHAGGTLTVFPSVVSSIVDGAQTVRIKRLIRQDGLPDNCGNGAPLYRPPSQVTGGTPPPPDIIVNIPGLGPTNVTVSLDDDGKPVVCIPSLDICATVDIDLDPSGGNDGNGDGGGGRPPGEIGEPSDEIDADDDGDAEGEAPEGSVLVGLSIQIKESPIRPNKFTEEVFRAVGFVYMGVPGNLALHFGGATLKERQFIFAEKDNLISWKVTANPGYTLGVTPYYLEE